MLYTLVRELALQVTVNANADTFTVSDNGESITLSTPAGNVMLGLREIWCDESPVWAVESRAGDKSIFYCDVEDLAGVELRVNQYIVISYNNGLIIAFTG